MSNENKLTLEDILIVQDYLDVFPDDLPGLPPKRRVEFIIDLVTRTTTTSMAPYRSAPMAPYRSAPMALTELKVQLQMLLDKDFIKPSVSPRGSSILL